jgi:PAS domain S-box-containing protein
MTTELRKTGISVMGDIPWGAHFCYFYETKQDLLDILVPYFKVGLENNEFCLWVISTPLTREEAINALRQAVPDHDRHLMERNIEILSYDEWYFKDGVFDLSRVIAGWNEKLNVARARGYEGMRVSGDTGWIQKEGRRDFREYEKEVALQLEDKRMIVLCAYPLANHAAAEILDVARNHQFAVARRYGSWDVLEAPELMQAKREIKKLNEELEQRVNERTGELAAANEELRREISERKLVEKALQESRRRLEVAQRIAHVGHYEHDLDTGVIVMSEENYRILGLEPQESFTLARVFELMHPDDRARVHRVRNEAVRTGQHFDVEFRCVRPDGEVRFVHSQGDVIRDEQGRARRTFGIAQDITERKQAEDALRRSEDRIRLIIDTIPVMAWSLRPDGVVDFLNQRWMDYAGLSLEQYVEDPTRPVHPEDIPGVVEKWLADMVAGEPNEDEIRLRRADGEYRWFLVRNAPLRDEQDNVVKWYGASIDIQERKQVEEQLRQSESQLAEAQHLARVGSWNWDLQSNALNWSDEHYCIFGVDPQAFNPAFEDVVTEFIRAEDRALVRGVIENSLKTQEPFSFYYRILSIA